LIHLKIRQIAYSATKLREINAINEENALLYRTCRVRIALQVTTERVWMRKLSQA
jgi:hypothetical protein